MTHTPGPWTIGTRWHDDIEIHAGSLVVCAVYSDYNGFNGPPRDIQEVNARLIAAAPDLLDALRDLVSRCDGEEGVRADGSNIQTMRAHAVLAKIDGGAA